MYSSRSTLSCCHRKLFVLSSVKCPVNNSFYNRWLSGSPQLSLLNLKFAQETKRILFLPPNRNNLLQSRNLSSLVIANGQVKMSGTRPIFLTKYSDIWNPLPLVCCYSTSGKTHYDVLGIQRNATSDDIRKAFLKMSKECHPDMNSSDPENHSKFVLVNEAYSVLSKPLLRRNYDLSLAGLSRASTSGDSRAYSNPSSSVYGPYYHAPGRDNPFTDKQFYENRDKSQDEHYKRKPYYGVHGVQRISNTQIVATCLSIMVIGIIFHYIAVSRSTALHLKNLEERDIKNHALWEKAKQNANLDVLRRKAYNNDES